MTQPQRPYSRHESRAIAFQILYQYDLTHDPEAPASSLDHELETYFKHFKVSDAHREFVSFLVHGVLDRRETLDSTLQPYSPKWKITRLSNVDRTLLRLGSFELLHGEERAPQVIINEAVELAKTYGSTESPAFVNAVLDALSKKLP